MTQINYDELALLKTVDQAIVWAVLSLHRANTHENNFWYSDNATIRQQVAKDLCNWTIKQDPGGTGQFSFTALMVVANNNPMVAKVDAAQHIKSYSDFLLTDQVIEEPTTNKGYPIPELPAYITTLEQALYFFMRIADAIGRLIRYANRAATLPEPLSGNVCMVVSGNHPELTGLQGLAGQGVDTAEGIIDQFGDTTPIYQGFSDYIQDIFDNLFTGGGGDGSPGLTDIDTAGGYKPVGIETLPVCKEQDPTVTNLAPGNLQDILTR